MVKAVFLDRDGVLIEDVHLLSSSQEIQLIEGVPNSLTLLKKAGYLLFIVSNQPVIARGIITEKDVEEINSELEHLIFKAGGPIIDGFDYCPHHPNASLPRYRIKCNCRKPEPGMILKFAELFNVDLSSSYMIGDRITDIIAGKKSGCKTILVQSGMHLDAPIETWEPIDSIINADFVCKNINAAAEIILENDLCVP